jgi:hypothetical protein
MYSETVDTIFSTIFNPSRSDEACQSNGIQWEHRKRAPAIQLGLNQMSESANSEGQQLLNSMTFSARCWFIHYSPVTS